MIVLIVRIRGNIIRITARIELRNTYIIANVIFIVNTVIMDITAISGFRVILIIDQCTISGRDRVSRF